MGSPRRLGLIAALLALGLALGAWWLLQTWEIELPVGPPVGSQEVHEDAAAATAPMTTRVAVAGQTNAAIVELPSEAGLPRTPSCSITARVLDDAGAPVEGASVEVFAARYGRREPDAQDAREIAWLGPRRDVPLATMTTGPDGTCEFRLERELVYVAASHPRVGRSVVRTAGIRELGSSREVELWLLRPVLVRGVVLDEHCVPVPYAQLFCEGGSPAGKYVPTGWFSANAMGRFEFEAGAGFSSVVQARRGKERSPRVGFSAEDDAEVVVALAGAFSLRGVVRDSVGRPLAGAEVHTKPGLRDHPRGWRRPEGATGVFRGTPVGVTDRDGNFELPLESCGRYTLAASADPGLLSTWSEEVTVSLQDPHPSCALVVKEALTLRGCVRNHDGTPAILFDLLATDRISHVRLARVTTNTDGTFALELPQGKSVVFSGKGLAPIEVGPDSGNLQLVLEPALPPLVITGDVFSPDGAPAKDFKVEWLPTDQGEALLESVIPPELQIEGNAFRLTTPLHGTDRQLVVTPKGRGLPPAIAGPFSGPGPHRVSLTFPRTAACSVRVFANGQPAAALEVDVSLGSLGSLRTDAQGRVQFVECWPGKGGVVVRRGREVLAWREIVLLPGQNPELTLEVTL